MKTLKEERQICSELLVRNMDGGSFIIPTNDSFYKLIEVSSEEEKDFFKINQLLKFIREFYSDISIDIEIIKNRCFEGKYFLLVIKSPVTLEFLSVGSIKELADKLEKEVLKIETEEKCFGEIWKNFTKIFYELFREGS